MITIGEVVAVHGVLGEVRVMPHTDFPERFDHMETARLAKKGSTPRSYKITSVRVHTTKSLLLLKFEGIDTRNAAEELIGAFIEVEDDEAVKLPEGVYFEHDIIGLSVFTTSGRDLGPVKEILRTGANDVYETPVCLIPVIPDVVKQIDIENGRITIEPIPGLLDEDK